MLIAQRNVTKGKKTALSPKKLVQIFSIKYCNQNQKCTARNNYLKQVEFIAEMQVWAHY